MFKEHLQIIFDLPINGEEVYHMHVLLAIL